MTPLLHLGGDGPGVYDFLPLGFGGFDARNVLGMPLVCLWCVPGILGWLGIPRTP